MGEPVDATMVLNTIHQLQSNADAMAERLRTEAEQAALSSQIWKELQTNIRQGWWCHVLMTLNREAELIDTAKAKDANVLLILNHLKEETNGQVTKVMRRYPTLLEQAASGKLLLDAEGRHPRYTFEKGFFWLEVNEQTRMAQLSDHGGKLAKIPADPEAVVAAIQREKQRVFERKFDEKAFLTTLRKEYLAMLRSMNEQDGASAPIRNVMRNIKKTTKIREDEFIFDLSRLVKQGPHKIDGRTLDFQQTRDAKDGLMLLLENGGGSWGAGKTHFFRLLRETAFKNNCMVSNVELGKSEAPLDKFERIFYSIIRKVATPYCYTELNYEEAAPFGIVLREALSFLGTGRRLVVDVVTHDELQKAEDALMLDRNIDVDFKKIVSQYWRTFLPNAVGPSMQELTRADLLQWFSGEGTVGTYRKRFSVNKIVNKDNAKLMLQSLAGFVRLSGYDGLVILFDEAEMSFSAMRDAQLKDAHNNLLSLINNIESLSGLFLIYATVPDFYTNPKRGIIIYPALLSRVGKPEDRAPRALDTVWNLDKLATTLAEYQAAAVKIKGIYGLVYDVADLPSEAEILSCIAEMKNMHPENAGVRFWRVLVTGTVKYLDDQIEGTVRSAEEVYYDTMDEIKDL